MVVPAQNINNWPLALLAVFVLINSSFANDAPEYIKAVTPITASLEDVPSTTTSIGVTPKSWIQESSFFSYYPSQYLPRLRNKYIPITGQPFIDDVLISVRPRIYHRYSKGLENSNSEATAVGGAIALESGWLNDFLRLTFVGYTSQKFYGPEDRDGSGLLRKNQQSYTVLGEAFAEFKLGKSSVYAGRIPVDVPYINGNDSRMSQNTFEGIGFRTLAIPKLQFGGGHISRIKFRNSSNFESMSARAGAPGSDKGVTPIAMRYNFTDDVYISAINQYGWDTFNTLYLESDRLMHLTDDLDLRIGVQFTDQRSVGEELAGSFSTQSLGAKASLGYRGFITSASFTDTTSGSKIRNPWGGSPSFNSSLISNFDRAGEKSARIRASYDFTEIGLTGFATAVSWIYGDTPDSGSSSSQDQQEYSVTLDYQPPVEMLKNFWLRFRYAINERAEATNDREDFRVILNYSYSF